MKFKQTSKINKYNKKEEGVALYFAVLTMTAILAIGLGIANILIVELRIARDIGNFVPAIYASDAGVEEALYTVRWTTEFQGSSTSSPVADCDTSTDCIIRSDKCGSGSDECMENDAIYRGYVLKPGAPGCSEAPNVCIFITGTLRDTNRAFEIGF